MTSVRPVPVDFWILRPQGKCPEGAGLDLTTRESKEKSKEFRQRRERNSKINLYIIIDGSVRHLGKCPKSWLQFKNCRESKEMSQGFRHVTGRHWKINHPSTAVCLSNTFLCYEHELRGTIVDEVRPTDFDMRPNAISMTRKVRKIRRRSRLILCVVVPEWRYLDRCNSEEWCFSYNSFIRVTCHKSQLDEWRITAE